MRGSSQAGGRHRGGSRKSDGSKSWWKLKAGLTMEEQLPQPRRVDRSLSVVDRPLADVRLEPNNPRVHTRNQIPKIARSVDNFGLNVAVLIGGHGQLIAG